MSENKDISNNRPIHLRRLTRWFGAWPLFCVILLWVALALFVFTALGWLWGLGDFWSWDRFLTNWRRVSDGATSLDLVKVSLTTIGGVSGVCYLVIKYRERASEERAEAGAELERVEQMLLSAVQQLGSDSPQVRIAGVYSLADVADTYRGDYRQRVVNILCGYLRSERGGWESVTESEEGNNAPNTTKTYITNDGAVESTILDVMARHLRKHRDFADSQLEVVQQVEDDQLWCDCSIDLHDSIINEHLAFDHTSFDNYADFRGVSFLKTANFESSVFSEIDFRESKFFDIANFKKSNFEGEISFWRARFSYTSDFSDCIFYRKADFERVRFRGTAKYVRANFEHDLNLNRSVFKRDAEFTGARFAQNAKFLKVKFTRESYFQGANFARNARFMEVTFARKAHFQGATFNSYANFQESTFTCEAHFVGATFSQLADFRRVTFSEKVSFQDVTFGGHNYFTDAIFNASYKDTKNNIFLPDSILPNNADQLPGGAMWAHFDE